MSRQARKNLQGRRKKKAPATPAAPAPSPEVLDLTIGRLRVRCAAAVALDPRTTLRDDEDHLEPGDLQIEEVDADGEHARAEALKGALDEAEAR